MRVPAVFLLAAAASWAVAGTAQAEPSAEWSSVGKPLLYMGPEADPAHPPAAAPEEAGGRPRFSNVIYVNRCVGGCTITKGPRNNSTTDTSWFPEGTDGQTYQLTEFAHDDATWNAIMDCVRDVYAPYDVIVTDEDPGTAPHTECYAAGLSSQLGLNSGGVGGAVAQNISLDSACSGGENGVAFAFLNGYPASQVEYMCSVIAQETGHTFGLLDHMRDCTDPMSASYYGPCNLTDRSYFRNRLMKCGDAADGPCVCGGNFVNSHAHLRSTFGESGNVQDAPTAQLISPTDGATITQSSIFGLDASGPRGVFRARIFMNGWPWGEWLAPDHIAPNTWPPSNYVVSLDPGLPDGVYDAEVHVYDDLGTEGVSDTITVTKGAACSDASSCLDGQKCENGHCFWDQPSGELGDACTVDQECIGPDVYDGQCVSDSSGTSMCTRDCRTGALDDCGDGFYCLETNAAEGSGVCWKAEGGGGCCSAGHETRGELAGIVALWLAAGGLVFRRRRSR